jgi:hypothetical protein
LIGVSLLIAALIAWQKPEWFDNYNEDAYLQGEASEEVSDPSSPPQLILTELPAQTEKDSSECRKLRLTSEQKLRAWRNAQRRIEEAKLVNPKAAQQVATQTVTTGGPSAVTTIQSVSGD